MSGKHAVWIIYSLVFLGCFVGCKKQPLAPFKFPMTLIPTGVPSSTPIPTATPYPTFPVCGPVTNTPTPTGDKVIGTITYTGGLGPVDTLHEIGIRLSPDSGMLLESDFHLVDSNGGSYTLDAPGSGTYYVSYGHDAGGLVFPEYGMVGSAYGSYNNLCLPPGSPIAVSGTTVLNLVFDDTCRFFGIYGNANYTGAMGVVEACTNLSLTFYLDSGYTVLLGSVSLPWNNKRYDWADAFGVIGTTYYVRAFFDQNGDAVGPCGAIPCVGTGDPYKDLGPFVTGFSTVANATFDDSLIWP